MDSINITLRILLPLSFGRVLQLGIRQTHLDRGMEFRVDVRDDASFTQVESLKGKRQHFSSLYFLLRPPYSELKRKCEKTYPIFFFHIPFPS